MKTYNWWYLAIAIIFLSSEGYWAGIIVERLVILPISLSMLFFCAGSGLAFIFAFLNSGVEKK